MAQANHRYPVAHPPSRVILNIAELEEAGSANLDQKQRGKDAPKILRSAELPTRILAAD